MSEYELSEIDKKIDQGIQQAIYKALEKHPKLGQSISIWKDGKVVTLTADQIPELLNNQKD